jgi:hypothetical protein
MEERVELFDLPVEVICEILSFAAGGTFALHELCVLKRVCKLFYDIVEEQIPYHVTLTTPEEYPVDTFTHKCLTLINTQLQVAEPQTLVFVNTIILEYIQVRHVFDMLYKWYYFETGNFVIVIKKDACFQMRNNTVWNCAPDALIFKPNMLLLLLDDGALGDAEHKTFVEVHKKVKQLSGHTIIFMSGIQGERTPTYLLELKNKIGCVL